MTGKGLLILIFSFLMTGNVGAQTSCLAYYQHGAVTNVSDRVVQIFNLIASDIQTGRVHPVVIGESILRQTNQVMSEVNQIVQTIIMPDKTRESKNHDALTAGNTGISQKLENIRDNGARLDKSFWDYKKTAIAKDTAIQIREARQLQIKIAKYLEAMESEIRELSDLKVTIEDIKTRVDQEFEYVSLVLEGLRMFSAADLVTILQSKIVMLSSAQTLLQAKISILDQRIVTYHGLVEESRMLSQIGIHSVIDSMPNLMSVVKPLLGTDANLQTGNSSTPVLETHRQKESSYRLKVGLPAEGQNETAIKALLQTVRLTLSAQSKSNLIQTFVSQNYNRLGIYNLIELLHSTPDPETRGSIAKLVFTNLASHTTLGAVLDLVKTSLRAEVKDFILISYANRNSPTLKNSELELLANYCLTSEAKSSILKWKR